MQEEEKKEVSGTGTMTAEALEAHDVLAGVEEWAPVETKLVLWSYAIAIICLIIGLIIVPTSIFH